MSVDFLIVGQGLAGSLLAFELIQRGGKVLVVDNGLENASQVAAGLINPITGMRLVKSAYLEQLLPAARQVYTQLGQLFGQSFYIEKPMLRRLQNPNEYAYALKRLDNPDYRPYLPELHEAPEPFLTGAGVLRQRQTGYLRTSALLASLKQFFVERHSYSCEVFQTSDLQLGWTPLWRGMPFKQLIFCEGYRAIDNPWFGRLPFQPAKGQILTLSHPVAADQPILNYGHWLIPINDQTIRIGATFEPDDLTTTPTEAGKQQLLKSLSEVCSGFRDARLLKPQANIRPCTLDKQPFLGTHPAQSQLHIFNGFGAKGSLQIPWYSQRFADYLLTQSPLPPLADIARYHAAHFLT